MHLASNGMSCNSIWFAMGGYLNKIADTHVDIAFTPQINQWNGSSDIQLKMKDMTILL